MTQYVCKATIVVRVEANTEEEAKSIAEQALDNLADYASYQDESIVIDAIERVENIGENE